jgi:hypothetical protein
MVDHCKNGCDFYYVPDLDADLFHRGDRDADILSGN